MGGRLETLVEELKAGKVRVELVDPPPLGSSDLATARELADRRSAAIERGEMAACIYRPPSSEHWSEQMTVTRDESAVLIRAGAIWRGNFVANPLP